MELSVSGPVSSLLWWGGVGDGTEDESEDVSEEEDVVEEIDEFGDESLNESGGDGVERVGKCDEGTDTGRGWFVV